MRCSHCTLESTAGTRLLEMGKMGHGVIETDERVVEICACKPWIRTLIKVEAGQECIYSILEETEEWVDGHAA